MTPVIAAGLRPVRALALLIEVDLRLRRHGFARVNELLGEHTGCAVPHPCLAAEARRMAVWLRWASRFVPGARCLHRSIALALWFRRRGVTADLCMGVRATENGIAGHAWVECDGVLFNDEPTVYDDYKLLEEVVQATQAGA